MPFFLRLSELSLPRMTIEPKHEHMSFDGRRHTSDFEGYECQWFMRSIKEACVLQCKYPAKFSQINANGTTSIDYFGVVYFESDKYYVRVRQDVSFENNRCIGEQDNIKENYLVDMRPKGNTEPSYKTVCDVTNVRCFISDIETFHQMQTDFQFLRALSV